MKKKRADALRLMWQSFKVYLFSVLGVGVMLILDELRNGIRGVEIYVPNITEIVVALVVAYLAIILDETLGGIDIKNREVWIRKRKQAFLVGISAIAVISKLMGG